MWRRRELTGAVPLSVPLGTLAAVGLIDQDVAILGTVLSSLFGALAAAE